MVMVTVTASRVMATVATVWAVVSANMDSGGPLHCGPWVCVTVCPFRKSMRMSFSASLATTSVMSGAAAKVSADVSMATVKGLTHMHPAVCESPVMSFRALIVVWSAALKAAFEPVSRAASWMVRDI